MAGFNSLLGKLRRAMHKKRRRSIAGRFGTSCPDAPSPSSDVYRGLETLEDRTLLSVTINNGLDATNPLFMSAVVDDGGEILSVTSTGTGGGNLIETGLVADLIGQATGIVTYFDRGNRSFDLADGRGSGDQITNRVQAIEPIIVAPGEVQTEGIILLNSSGSSTIEYRVLVRFEQGTTRLVKEVEFFNPINVDMTQARVISYFNPATTLNGFGDIVSTSGANPAETRESSRAVTITNLDTSISYTQRTDSATNMRLIGFGADIDNEFTDPPPNSAGQLLNRVENGGYTGSPAGRFHNPLQLNITRDLAEVWHQPLPTNYYTSDVIDEISTALIYGFDRPTGGTVATEYEFEFRPDLAVQITTDHPGPYSDGGSFDVTVNIGNTGFDRAVGEGISIKILASEDDTVGGFDRIIDEFVTDIDLDINESVDIVRTVDFSSFRDREYFLLVQVDSENDLLEVLDGINNEDFVDNQSPTVDAGTNQTIIQPQSVMLSGTMTDDGLPGALRVPQRLTLTSTWTQTMGPADSIILDRNALETEVTFTTPGTYEFTLSAFDGEFVATDTVEITVNPFVAENQFQGTGRANSLAQAADGSYHLAYFDANEGALKYVTKPETGAWSTPQTIDNGSPEMGQYVSLAIDSTGVPHVAYYDAFQGDLRYAVLNTITSTWDTQVVHSRRTVGLYPSLLINESDMAVVAYYHSSYGNLIFAEQTGPATWNVQNIDVGDGGEDTGRYPSLAMIPNTNLYSVAYENTSMGHFRFAEQAGNGQWITQTIDSTQDGGGYVSLVYDNNGTAAVSYYDGFNGDLKFARRSGGWETQSVAVKRTQGLYSSLVFDRENIPHIFFLNKSTNQLVEAKGTILDTTTWTFTSRFADGGRHANAILTNTSSIAFTVFDSVNDGVEFQTILP